MSTNHKYRVFLSAVSSEFEKARSQVASDLRSHGLEVKVQEDFRAEPGADTILRLLHDYIKACDAVVCIVGRRSGGSPADAEVRPFTNLLPTEVPGASYTQWEFFLARHYKKRLSLYRAGDGYQPDRPASEHDDGKLQDGFVTYLEQQGLYCPPFATIDELGRRVLREDWPKGGAVEKVMPKGLRSFDSSDAKFFLQLLPGPFDADGLPESIRFWKHRIETTDEMPFAVGVVYGPSGCGKSSLLKAGLLPRLSSRVLSTHFEATADDTEVRLLKALRARCPDLPIELDLKASIVALRSGQGIRPGCKLLVVIDQFEQWLHAHRGQHDTELVQALRECDGQHVQVMVTIRDDFWVPLSRFMGELGIKLLEGQNLALVDLFDMVHARNVLQAFGRAYDRLPEKLTPDHEAFLDQALQGLSQDGRVISVRLSLFAQMMKDKPWTPGTFKEVGGTEGIGVTFLEETFSASTANKKYRTHQNAVMAVLRALLPEQGSDIKGQMRSDAELRGKSGYQDRPQDFAELLRILDNELRLITPTDHESGEASVAAGHRFYQLTHDYLVPSLREWLTRKQKETRRGRAELLLAERAAAWNAKPEDRLLPSVLEHVRICALTRRQHWTVGQKKLMRRARRVHWQRGAALAVMVAVLTFAGFSIRNRVIEQQNAQQAKSLVAAILKADVAQVPAIVQELGPYRAWADSLLRTAFDDHPADSPERLKAALALLPVDPKQVDYLRERLLASDPSSLPIIRNALADYRDRLKELLWKLLDDAYKPAGERFNAACALATYDPDNADPAAGWKNVSTFVADQLVAALQNDPSHYALTLDFLRPVKGHLLAPLAAIFRNAERSDLDRSVVTKVLADYASGDAPQLAGLVLDADARQFAVLYPVLANKGKEAVELLNAELARKLSDDPNDPQSEVLARRQANAAAALIRLAHADQVWPLFKHPGTLKQFGDPRVRSYVVDRLSPLGCDPQVIVARFDKEQDVSARRALILTLGQFGADKLPEAARTPLVEKFAGLYRDDADPGIHGACEWLLRTWGQSERIAKVDEQLKGKPAEKKQWYVNGQGQTLAIVKGPVEFQMGSPVAEPDREGGPTGKIEQLHAVKIDRSFAIATHEVTLAEFLKFRSDHLKRNVNEQYVSPNGKLDRRCPATSVTWYDAAAYCNWLTEEEEKAGTINKGQRCYEPVSNDGKEEYAEGMKPADDYLHRTGYRLPTEAEWEYACRAFSKSSRYYGQNIDLLPRYAWYTKNSLDRWMLPVGSLLPNDLGLYDMQGNALEWCEDAAALYEAGEDVENRGAVKDSEVRVLRGGSFSYLPAYVRSAYRYRYLPTYRNFFLGFRPARTYP